MLFEVFTQSAEMIRKIFIGSEELNTALEKYTREPSEDRYYRILAALAESFDVGDRFFVAFEGDYFQSIREDGQDYLVLFTCYESAECGPDTDLAVLDLEELIGNILSDEEMAGFVIDPFTDAVFIDREACMVIRSAAMAGPLISDASTFPDLTPEEKLMFANAMEGDDEFADLFPDEWGGDDDKKQSVNDPFIFDFSKGNKNLRS